MILLGWPASKVSQITTTKPPPQLNSTLHLIESIHPPYCRVPLATLIASISPPITLFSLQSHRYLDVIMVNDEPEKGDKGNGAQLNCSTHSARIKPLTFATVSWNWSGGQPGGKVVETKDEGEIAIKSKRGNTIKKNASPSNPAVHIGRSGNDVVKRASELMVDEKASGSGSGEKKSKSPAPKENGDGKGDKKREHEEDDDGDGADEAAADKKEDEVEEEKKEVVKKPAAKKQKKEPAAGKKKKAAAAEEKPAATGKEKENKPANGADEAKKGRGRPKGTATSATGAVGKKKKNPKPRATEGIGSRTRSRA